MFSGPLVRLGGSTAPRKPSSNSGLGPSAWAGVNQVDLGSYLQEGDFLPQGHLVYLPPEFALAIVGHGVRLSARSWAGGW